MGFLDAGIHRCGCSSWRLRSYIHSWFSGSVIIHKRETAAASNELARYKLATEGKVAEATAAGIAAGEKAGHAQADVDAARIEIARQQTLAAEAQLETQRLKEEMAWRTISDLQKTKFRSGFVGIPPANLRLSVSTISGNPESTQYAIEIADLLRSIGFQVSGVNSAIMPGAIPEGIIVRVRDRVSLAGQAAGLLQMAFRTAGIDTPGQLDPSLADDLIEIFVGIKPRGQLRK